MKFAVVFFAFLFSITSVYGDDENKNIDQKLIEEVKAELAAPVFNLEEINEPAILIYNTDGTLLYSFEKDNIDPVAMRNVDLLMELKSQKIFIKSQELKPNI
ncbi:hypothetical protein [Marivirga arenosa]|uniref:Uncharacterized protein n=1 Tax=Marivirga arenosa TaxID=3059076 RepID=A0AA49GC16_9BACT|nr:MULTISPECIES: hypothetical protein [unclassified Marivirga]WKK78801.1 hypothetical protein QYS47_14590 [Marivirga sp. BKB1-2]WMN07967.1 hypothetical protein QYS48_30550 [Marivirga sp. ABR2-2]